MKYWERYIIYSLLAILIILDFILLCREYPRTSNLGFDYVGVIIAIFSLLITILIGWHISEVISIRNIRKDTDRNVEFKLKEQGEQIKNEIKDNMRLYDDKMGIFFLRFYANKFLLGNATKIKEFTITLIKALDIALRIDAKDEIAASCKDLNNILILHKRELAELYSKEEMDYIMSVLSKGKDNFDIVDIQGTMNKIKNIMDNIKNDASSKENEDENNNSTE